MRTRTHGQPRHLFDCLIPMPSRLLLAERNYAATRALVILLLVAAAPLAAQQQEPATAAFTGLVRDTTGQPIPLVEILIEGAGLATRSGPDGRFRFDRIPPGEYVVRVRRVGFDPAELPYTARAGEETQVEVRIVALALQLESVTSFARVQSISGWVADSAWTPLTDAMVELAGTGRDTLVREDGHFHFGDLPPGSYLIVVRRLGFSPWRRSITLREGDRVDVSALLAKAPDSWIVGDKALSGTNARTAIAFMDMRRRKARGGSRVVTVTREELVRLGKQPLDLALSRLPMVTAKGYSGRELMEYLIIFDGQPIQMDRALALFSADGVEMVEIMPPDPCAGGRRFSMSTPIGAKMEGCSPGVIYIWSR